MFGDFRTFWFDPENSDRVIIAGDGGIAISYDGGRTGDAYNNLPLGSIYAIGVDNEEPTSTPACRITRTGRALERSSRPRRRSGLAGGWRRRRDVHTPTRQTADGCYHAALRRPAAPRPEARLPQEHHAAAAAEAGISLAVVHPHPHLPARQPVLYTGGQHLLRSTDRGDHWVEISPDLSTNPADKILPESEGSVPGGIPGSRSRRSRNRRSPQG